MKRHRWTYLLILVTLFASTGASCPWTRKQLVEPAPVAFESPPTLDEIIRTVNRNGQSVQSLRTDNATLSVQGLPALRVSMAMQPPRNIRMRASFVGLGQVLDFGSNDDLFWALVDTPEALTNVPKAVYYARHDQFRLSNNRGAIPIKPDWLITAMGLVYLDPNGSHEGPYQRDQGLVEIRSRVPSNDGELSRVTIVHDTYGWVLEQHLYDPTGQLLASAKASEYRYYPLADASLPHRVEVILPPPAQSFTIEVNDYLVNQNYGDARQMWTMPEFDGYPMVDLTAPQPPLSGAAPAIQPPAFPPANMQQGTDAIPPAFPQTGYLPQYRGYSPSRY